MTTKPTFYRVSVSFPGCLDETTEYFATLAEAKQYAKDFKEDSFDIETGQCTMEIMTPLHKILARNLAGGYSECYLQEKGEHGILQVWIAGMSESPIGSMKKCSSFGNDYELIQTDYEVAEITGSTDYGLAFVKYGNAEILEIWVSEDTIPYNNVWFERIQ